MIKTTRNGDRPWLLVSDIDDTLTGDNVAMERLGHAIANAPERLWFAVNSSRPLESVMRTLTDVFPSSLKPDAIITALGTEILLNGQPLPGWDARFAGWPHKQVFLALDALGFQPHAPQYQTARKVSFAVPAGDDQTAARSALQKLGIACRIIASGVDDFDVIPHNGGKDVATLALAQSLGFPLSQLIVAGDSGNDLAMFLAAEKKIAVANARQELLDGLNATSFYHARAPNAAGVHEGLVHYGALAANTFITKT